MKDLKHLIYFESLLEETNNELIRKAQEEGQLAMGYTCYHLPEVLLNVDNCFSVRMRAPNTGGLDIASYYMSNYTCEYCRALLERAIEGGYNFLDGLAGVDACAQMNRCMENIELLKCVDKPNFFVTHADIPYKHTDYTEKHYVIQMQNRVLNTMHDKLGVDVSDAAIRDAVVRHNEICKVITEISEFRKLDNPPLTGYEFHIINMVSFCCPHKLILPYLQETLAEIKKRKPDAKPWYRCRVGIVGSEVDDPNLTRMLEDAGAFIAFDRFCFGALPGREVIELNDEEPALVQVCRHYLITSECPRFMSTEKIEQRRVTVDRLAREYNADGIIFENVKFCDFWAFERALAGHIQADEYGHPVLTIDRPYNAKTSGQLRTRFQAFVESLEIKRIQKGKEV